jgi:beta-glucanase (GH16 family)
MRAASTVKRIVLLALLHGAVSVLAFGPSARGDCDRIPDCRLVWADEFDGRALDTSKWEPMLGTGTDYGLPAGWGNNELQYYQEENATVADGFLTITAREEAVSGRSYTSARLRTLGMGEWTYGRMEMRARLPIGQGLWPAFWMLPSDLRYGGWAASGEIDIMEYLGSDPSRAYGTIHYGARWPNSSSSQSGYVLPNGTFHDDFHVFAIEWEPGEIRWYVDGTHYGTSTEWFSTEGPFPAPFDVDFHLLLNVAVGGNWPGSPDSTTAFPQELVADYIRVYQSALGKGTQASTAALIHTKAIKMKKIRAKLIISLENQARKKDGPQDPRQVSCSVRTQGKKSALVPKGSLQLVLTGRKMGSRWSGRTITAPLDSHGDAGFSAADIKALVDEATGDGSTIERLVIEYDGAGRKKIKRTELDCWQQPG